MYRYQYTSSVVGNRQNPHSRRQPVAKRAENGVDYVVQYMNDQALRDTFHIPASFPAWSGCSGEVYSHYKVQQEASLWIWEVLKMNGIRMLKYTGDTDGVVPFTGTRRWIKKLNWKLLDEWRPWMNPTD